MAQRDATAKLITMVTSSQEAPGDLEQIRELLNSWLIPNDVRVPEDHFDKYVAAPHSPQSPTELHGLRALRDQVRAVVEMTAPLSSLDGWVTKLKVRPRFVDDGPKVTFDTGKSTAGALLSIVLCAVQDGTWGRLKACPDCRWVFFDRTRNGTKRWCLMNAGNPAGRACGTNAKVRRFRERQRADSQSRGEQG
jgi:predicted RNA-binding Zn ribbon-like protein